MEEVGKYCWVLNSLSSHQNTVATGQRRHGTELVRPQDADGARATQVAEELYGGDCQ